MRSRHAASHRLGEAVEDTDRAHPVETSVRDALAIHERSTRDEVLPAADEIALDHHAADAPLARLDLSGERLDDGRLLLRPFAAVAVARIDHQPGRDPGGYHLTASGLDACRIVIGSAAAAQNDVAVRIARGGGNSAAPLFGHREEVVRVRGGANGVHGYAHVSVRSVLEPDRTRKSGGELAVHLALGRPCADS